MKHKKRSRSIVQVNGQQQKGLDLKKKQFNFMIKMGGQKKERGQSRCYATRNNVPTTSEEQG